MKYRTILIYIVTMFLVSLQNYTDAIVYKIYTLPELIQEAPLILSGTIQMENHQPVINIQKTIKGTLSGKYKIEFIPVPLLEAPTFLENEQVILFVSEPIGNTIHLIGMGDQAIWPKKRSKWASPDQIYSYANFNDLTEIILDLIIIQNTRDYDMQISKAQKLLTSTNPAAQLAGLQLINYFNLSPDEEKHNISKIISTFGIPLLSSKEIVIKFEALQALNNLPNVVLIDYLIEMLTDSHFGVRKNAFDIISFRIKDIADKGQLTYDPNWPDNRLNIAKQNLKEWWKSKRKIVLKNEIPSLIEKLESEDLLVRKYAISYLKMISKDDFGYKPDAFKDKRKIAIEKWKQWFQEIQQ